MGELLTRLLAQYRELKRRKVIRAAAAYAVVAWIAVQVAAVVFPALSLPRWTVTATVLTALAGFPVALVLAWVVEPVPEGDGAPSDGAPPSEAAAGGAIPEGDAPASGAGGAGTPVRLRVVHPVALLLVVVGVAGAGGWLAWQGRPLELSAFPTRGWVVPADFRAETTGESFAAALSAGLELSLEQSPHLNLMPRGRVLDALRRMRRDPGDELDPETAREVAVREGADLVLAPTVAGVGGRYRLGVRVQDPGSGETLRTLTARAEGREGLLEALDGLAAELREVLGEPKLRVLRRSEPLDRVTTPSLQALEQYSLARRAHVRNDFEEARRRYGNAIREDSTFTTALASLGMLEYERFDRERGRELLELAVEGADELPDRERYGVLTAHAIAVEGDLEKAYGHQEALADLYPDNYVGHNNLGRIGYLLGRHVDAVAAYQRALDIYPALGVASSGLYYTLTYELGRLDSALSVARAAVEADSANARSRAQLGLGLVALDSLEAAAGALRQAVEIDPSATDNHHRLAHVYRLQGRYAEAESVLRGLLARDSTSHSARYDLAAVLDAAGRASAARPLLDEVLAHWDARLDEDPDPVVRYYRAAVLARMGEEARARRALDDALAADSTLRFERAHVAALLGDEAEALRLLRRAVDEGFTNFVWMKLHPDLARLHDRRAFREMIREGLFGGGPLPGERTGAGGVADRTPPG